MSDTKYYLLWDQSNQFSTKVNLDGRDKPGLVENINGMAGEAWIRTAVLLWTGYDLNRLSVDVDNETTKLEISGLFATHLEVLEQMLFELEEEHKESDAPNSHLWAKQHMAIERWLNQTIALYQANHSR